MCLLQEVDLRFGIEREKILMRLYLWRKLEKYLD